MVYTGNSPNNRVAPQVEIDSDRLYSREDNEDEESAKVRGMHNRNYDPVQDL